VNSPTKTSLPRRILRAAGSGYLGLGLIAALAAYLTVVSLFQGPLARALSVGESGVYAFWPLPALGAMLCANLAVATATRVPLDLPHAGAWCSHAGVLVLAAGAAWYAAGTVEGACVTSGGAGKWREIDHVYLRHTAAVYVAEGEAGPWRATALADLDPDGPPPAAGARALDVAVEGVPFGTEARVVGVWWRAVEQVAWQPCGPNDAQGLRLHVADADWRAEVVLSEEKGYQGRGYVIHHQPRVSPERLSQMAAAAARGESPVAGRDVAIIATGPRITPTLVVCRGGDADARAATRAATRPAASTQASVGGAAPGRVLPVRRGEPLGLVLAGRRVRIDPQEYVRLVREVWQGPVAHVEVREGGRRGGVELPLSMSVAAAEAATVALADGTVLRFVFARRRAPLGATVRLLRAEYETFPGSRVPKDYRCEVEISPSGGGARRAVLSLNRPLSVGGYQLSQGAWLPDPETPREIVLSARKRPGMPVIWLGCAMIVLGFAYALCVKPLLLRRKEGRP
jgi:hypothetical protein